MIQFAAPHWFLLLPAVALAGWFWRGLHPVSYTHLTLPTNREV